MYEILEILKRLMKNGIKISEFLSDGTPVLLKLATDMNLNCDDVIKLFSYLTLSHTHSLTHSLSLSLSLSISYSLSFTLLFTSLTGDTPFVIIRYFSQPRTVLRGERAEDDDGLPRAQLRRQVRGGGQAPREYPFRACRPALAQRAGALPQTTACGGGCCGSLTSWEGVPTVHDRGLFVCAFSRLL